MYIEAKGFVTNTSRRFPTDEVQHQRNLKNHCVSMAKVVGTLDNNVTVIRIFLVECTSALVFGNMNKYV